jgi:hypothetical protein
MRSAVGKKKRDGERRSGVGARKKKDVAGRRSRDADWKRRGGGYACNRSLSRRRLL